MQRQKTCLEPKYWKGFTYNPLLILFKEKRLLVEE